MAISTGSRVLVTLAFASFGCIAQAQQPTDQDYARAASFLGQSTQPLVDHDVRRVHWLDDSHFWYVDHDAKGDHYLVMDAATGKASPSFDQKKLAGALGKASGKKLVPDKLHVK